MKRQPIEWEKIFTNCVPEKGLISKMYKELIQPTAKNTQTIQFKMGRSE